jgi:uncharacterized protein YjiS (DUF1127 family)
MRKTMKPIDTLPNTAGCISETPSQATAPAIGRFLANIEGLYQAWQKRRAWQKDLNHIAKFSPYLLRDIGLNASDIAGAQPKQHFASIDSVGRPG